MKYLIVLLIALYGAFAHAINEDIKDIDLDLDLPEDKPTTYPWEFKGAEITLELRQFADDDDDETYENQRSGRFKLHMEKPITNGLISIQAIARYDDQDPNRNRFWAEDAYLKKRLADKYDFFVGYKIFNYSAMEAFNPLDSINAQIFDVSIVNAEKMGELALGVSSEKFDGYMSFYLIPNPTQPILPGKNSRINLDQNLDEPQWMGSKDDEPRWDDHFLITWEGMIGDWDALILVSKSIDRTRTIVGTDDYNIIAGNARPNGQKFNTPYYFERYLSGFNLVGNWGDDLLKFSLAHSYYLSETEIYTAEMALASSTDPELLRTPADFTVGSVGYEHPLNFSGGVTSSLIFEYQYMSFAGNNNQADFPLANDIFFAWRFAFNDINSKELTLSSMWDLEGNEEGFVQLDYSQRFKEVFKINIGVLEYMIPDDSTFTGYGIFRDTEHAYINLTYYL